MLKHIPTVQPSSGSRNNNNHSHHHNDYGSQTISTNLHHQHIGGSTRLSAREQSSIYDSLIHPSKLNQQIPTVHRHPLNHSQLSVNNLSRLNNSHGLNFSTLSTSKHSIDSTSPVGGQTSLTTTQLNGEQRIMHNQINGGLDISRLSRLPSQTTPSPAPVNNITSATVLTSNTAPVASSVIHAPVNRHTQLATITQANISSGDEHIANQLDTQWIPFCLKGHNINNNSHNKNSENGVKEMLSFLGLLCLVSLLFAILSHIFLLKISPLNPMPSSFISPEEYNIVYEVTLVLCALALCLNLCCLLVCAIQFLFAMKLVKSSYNQTYRTSLYLQKSSASRMCAVGGFFISIPIFLTGMILYTFLQYHSTPAIVMSVFIGIGIVFCGCAMVHNVFVWQREKTNAMKEVARAQCEAAAQLQLQHQQQQQQQQQQEQQEHQSTNNQHQANNKNQVISSISRGNNCGTIKNNNFAHIHRGNQYHNQSQNHHDLLRHVPLSPTLLTLSTSPGCHNHSNIDVHRIPVSPSTTPADDHSPTSPLNKSLNRSQHHIQRDASGSISPGLPIATLDLSSAATTNSPHELSTLV
ncbi:mediator of RNA polymerase II transcription subunit 13 isoform X2 [Aphidius gifuensis]|uniref:mediator of RNA polymerase II transcription subunit 13 isoform X2 n=1 Tax=Aphidius gifuensis TaxID=684658 RepID=UPI001CDB66E2|nr:mediator of RNA polymerase II transcription subunit 13 isoform X2 [Aphidius gifuensis]